MLYIAQCPCKAKHTTLISIGCSFHVSLSISLLLSPCVTGRYGWFVGCEYRCVFVPSFFYAEGSCQARYCKNSWSPPSSSGISKQRYCTLLLFQQNFVRCVQIRGVIVACFLAQRLIFFSGLEFVRSVLLGFLFSRAELPYLEGTLAILLINLPWYGFMVSKHGLLYLSTFFGYHNLEVRSCQSCSTRSNMSISKFSVQILLQWSSKRK